MVNLLKLFILLLISTYPCLANNLFTVDIPISYSYQSKDAKTQIRNNPEKIIFILGADGGGMFGVAEISILNKIEQSTNLATQNTFEVMAGTSAGAIIIAALALKNKGQPKYTAYEVLTQYKELGNKIFTNSFWHRVKTLWGLIGPRYSSVERDKFYKSYFGASMLSDVDTDLIFNTYSITHRTTLQLTSFRAASDPEYDFKISDVISASTSAPSIFAPYPLENATKTWKDLGIDGAIYINNPILEAYLYAKKKYPGYSYVMLSLGAGRSPQIIDDSKNINKVMGWGVLQGLYPMFMISLYSQEYLVDKQMRDISKSSNNNIIGYFRLNFQALKNKHDIFDGSAENIKIIDTYTDNMLNKDAEILNEFISLLCLKKQCSP